MMSIMNSYQMDNVNRESQQKKSMYIQEVIDKQEYNLKSLKKKFESNKSKKNNEVFNFVDGQLGKVDTFQKYRKRMYDFNENLELREHHKDLMTMINLSLYKYLNPKSNDANSILNKAFEGAQFGDNINVFNMGGDQTGMFGGMMPWEMSMGSQKSSHEEQKKVEEAKLKKMEKDRKLKQEEIKRKKKEKRQFLNLLLKNTIIPLFNKIGQKKNVLMMK